MKFVLAAFCASCLWPAAAQVANPPSKQATASGNDSAVVPDGISFYHGQTYLLRNGRAALVDATLVPEGKVLTRAGRLVPMPPELTGRPEARNQITPSATSDAVQDGIVHMRGQSYLVRGTTLQPIDSRLIPEGAVLNATNTLSPLPSDFSGFNLERSPAGTSTLPTRTGDGTQALSGQAGVPQLDRSAPQAPRITTPQPDVVAPAGATGSTRTGMAAGGSSNANGSLPGAAYNGSTAAGVAAGIDTFGAQGGGRTFQPGVNATGTQTTTIQGRMATQQGTTGVQQSGTTGVQQGTVTNPNGTTSAAVSGNTSTVRPGVAGTVNMQGTTTQTGATTSQANPTATQTGAVTSQANPPATQTGAVTSQANPPATQIGTVGNQTTQTGTSATGGTNNPSSTPGSGSTANGVSPGTAGGTGTSGGGASGGTTGGGTSGGTSGSGTSGGGSSSGGGTSGGSSGGGTSGGVGGGTGGGGT